MGDGIQQICPVCNHKAKVTAYPGFFALRIGLPPIIVPKRELVNADFRHENLCYCLAVS